MKSNDKDQAASKGNENGKGFTLWAHLWPYSLTL